MSQITLFTKNSSPEKKSSHSIFDDLVSRNWISACAHGSIFISVFVLSIGIPLFILLDTEDEIVKGNTKEAINFHLNLWIYGAVIAIVSFLTFGLIGLILLPLWFLYHWSLSIVAVIRCLKNPDRVFYYPLIVRFF